MGNNVTRTTSHIIITEQRQSFIPRNKVSFRYTTVNSLYKRDNKYYNNKKIIISIRVLEIMRLNGPQRSQ